MKNKQATFLLAVLLLPFAEMADAHVGVVPAGSFAAGFHHPLSGLDHLTVMVAVGLWAALKGGRALWAWPAAFLGALLAGAGLGIAHVPVPNVEPAILASVVALGLMIALAVDLPVWLGGVIIGLFALFHGHAHGTESLSSAGGLRYVLGFAAGTAALHLAGIGLGTGLSDERWRAAIRASGAFCAALGLRMAAGLV